MGFSRQEYLVWVAISFSKGSSRLRGQTMSPALAGVFFTIEPDIPISLFLLATCFSCLRHDGVDGTWRKEKAISLRYILFNFYFFQLQFWMVLLYLWISQLDGFSKKILHNLIYYITFSKAILDFCNCLLEKLTYCLLSMNSSDVLK